MCVYIYILHVYHLLNIGFKPGLIFFVTAAGWCMSHALYMQLYFLCNTLTLVRYYSELSIALATTNIIDLPPDYLTV